MKIACAKSPLVTGYDAELQMEWLEGCKGKVFGTCVVTTFVQIREGKDVDRGTSMAWMLDVEKTTASFLNTLLDMSEKMMLTERESVEEEVGYCVQAVKETDEDGWSVESMTRFDIGDVMTYKQLVGR